MGGQPARDDRTQPEGEQDWGGWRGGDQEGSSSGFLRETELERMLIFWVRESGFKTLLRSQV